MSEMKNLTMTNKCKWPSVRKGAILGGLIGGLLTVIIQILCAQLPPGEKSGGLILAVPWYVSLIPTWGIYKLFGWAWSVGSFNEVPKHIFWSTVLVNFLLTVLLCSVVGLVIAPRRKTREVK